jgi:hypothetical protein
MIPSSANFLDSAETNADGSAGGAGAAFAPGYSVPAKLSGLESLGPEEAVELGSRDPQVAGNLRHPALERRRVGAKG